MKQCPTGANGGIVRSADIITGAKQAEGWRLEQISPGNMCWVTPAGRRYITTPTVNP